MQRVCNFLAHLATRRVAKLALLFSHHIVQFDSNGLELSSVILPLHIHLLIHLTDHNNSITNIRMPSNTHKSAAVPFINQKGERSMKRVKVERYVAGKKPAYAKEDDDEDEYYTTDDEDLEEQEEYDEEEEDDEAMRAFRADRKLDYGKQDDEEDDDDDESASSDNERRNSDSKIVKSADDGAVGTEQSRNEDNNGGGDDDDDDDDPRFRKLKQIESKSSNTQLIDVQIQQIQPKCEIKNVVLDEDDEEEEIRQRHALARRRHLEVPIGKMRGASISDPAHQNHVKQGDEEDDDDDDDDSQDGINKKPKRIETDDLLKDLKLTGISRSVRAKLKTSEEEEAEERRLKEMLEQARLEATFTRRTYEKIDQDIKKEVEKEALAKGDIGAREMSSVNTDDDDEELAYEEWKLREIKRVLRDRSERLLATSTR
jgi:microfibrillar-associated protein 1